MGAKAEKARTLMFTVGNEGSRGPQVVKRLRGVSAPGRSGVANHTPSRRRREFFLGSRTPRRLAQAARILSRQPNAGFSLLELLVVLMLLAILVAVVIPSVGRGVATVKLNTSSREIAAAIRLARFKAVREQQVYLLGFDLEKNEVELSSLSSSYRKAFELPAGIHLRSVSLLKGTLGSDAKNPFFYFMPNGHSQSFQLSLQNEQGRSLRVVQNSLKGAPRIEDGDSNRETDLSSD